MLLQLVVTVLLIFSAVSMFITGMGKSMPEVAKFIPIAAAVVYWVVIAMHKASGKTGIGGALLLILFYILVIFTIPTTVLVWMGDMGDKEKNIPAFTIGEGAVNKTIYIVYHPGITPMVTNVVNEFAGLLAKSGYKTVLYCANKDLKLDLKDAAAVGFSSPIYMGMIRPPVNNFIMKSDLKGIKTFILLTSGGPEDMGETGRVKAELEKQGASVIGTEKVSSGDKQEKVESKLEKLGKEIESSLK